MKVYRFAIEPEEDGYLFLKCITDPHLYTQARSMDEAVLMARDVIDCMYEERGVIVEFVVPPDVETPFERKRRTAKRSRASKRARKSRLMGTNTGR